MFFSLFSHLVGLFYRTIRMIDNGIKPVYVFDGKPPQMKSSEVIFVIKYDVTLIVGTLFLGML